MPNCYGDNISRLRIFRHNLGHVETRHGASLVGLNVNRFVLSEQYWLW
ncbi:MAG: hypothetical protein NHB32_13710 [Fischerella sp. CENA71]|nr:hypothetical protein [Fischerella sp. CENA71]